MTNFSAMSSDQLDEWLAVNVMEWHEDSDHMNLWLDKDGEITTDKEDWQPTRDLNQAVKCAEFLRDKYKITFEVQTWSEPKVYLVSMYSKDGKALADTEHKNLARALCEAVAMAVEGDSELYDLRTTEHHADY